MVTEQDHASSPLSTGFSLHQPLSTLESSATSLQRQRPVVMEEKISSAEVGLTERQRIFPGATNPLDCDLLTISRESSVKIQNKARPPPAMGFRLQPRTRQGATPTGRKRNAQCLHSYASSASPVQAAEGQGVMASPPLMSREEWPARSAFTGSRGTSPSSFESDMKSLSIKSPKTQISPIFLRPHGTTRSRITPGQSTMGSSFTAYSSPAGAIPHMRPRSSSSGSHSSPMFHSSSPASSSTRSSPRIAPLTILTRSGSSTEETTPQKRPPLHGRPSGMLLSLDATQSGIACHPELAVTATPDRPSVSVAFSPGLLATPEQSSVLGSSPVRSFACETPQTREDQIIQSAHCTPLPRIKLTPRSTPRAARERDLRPTDFVNLGTEWSNEKSSARPFNRPTSYLPMPEWSMGEPVPGQLQPSTNSVGGFDFYPTVMGTSVLESADSNMDFIQRMVTAQARAEAMDADGSLSDPDEEDSFVLTDPATLAEERFPSGPARQRQRLSYTSLEQQNSLRYSSTSNSLAQTHASNTSLLGIDFLRNDSAVSLSRHNTTGSGLRSLTCDAEGIAFATVQSGALVHGRRIPSNESLESIGLALDPYNEDTGRDLVTPPPIPRAATMPPCQPNLTHFHQKNYISGPTAGVIDEAISLMAYPTTERRNHQSPGTLCQS